VSEHAAARSPIWTDQKVRHFHTSATPAMQPTTAIDGSMTKEKSGSTLARPMTLQRFGSPPSAYCKAKPDWSAEPAAEIVAGSAEFL
jgi:hypothetical protein